jgi:hypothetical protein
MGASGAASGLIPTSGDMEKLMDCRRTLPEFRDAMAFLDAHDTPLQLVLQFGDVHLVCDPVSVIHPSVLGERDA